MGASELSVQSQHFQKLAVSWFRRGGNGIAVRQYERDENVYMEHDPADWVYCVDHGTLKVGVDLPDGRECPLALRLPGELAGELAACGQSHRRESLVAIERSTVRIASARTFLDFVRDGNLASLLLEYFAEVLVTQQKAIVILLLEPSERRLAHTLLEISRRHCEGPDLPLRLSQQQLGDMIGTTRSRVGQFLKKFRSLGLVRSYDSRGVLVDPDRLESYCR